MAQDINRLKLVLAENRRTNRWWQNKWENPLVQSVNGVVTPVSLIWRHWIKLLHCWMWIEES